MPEGVAAPEGANNADSGGALVPLLTLGIPGGGTTAIMLSALVLWGVRPGPLLMTESPDIFWGLVASMYIGNVVLLILNLPLVPVFAQILRLPVHVLFPIILGISLVGAYGVSGRLFDIGLLVGFGLLGYIMVKLKYPTAPLILGIRARRCDGTGAAAVAHDVAGGPEHLGARLDIGHHAGLCGPDPAAAAARSLQQGARAGDRRRRIAAFRLSRHMRGRKFERAFGGQYEQTFDLVPGDRGAGRRRGVAGAGAIQADASRSSSSFMAAPAPATTCSRARSRPSSTRRSSRRCASRSSTSRAAARPRRANYVVSKKNDPHVIACFTNIWLIDPLVQQAAVNRLQDMSPIARLVVEPALVVVLADSPFKTLGQFIEAAKANPGKLRWSGGSIMSRENTVRQLLMHTTGARWQFISFPSGGERLAALLGGHVEMMIVDPSEAGEQIRAGKFRAIAQVSERRLPGFPDIPTIKEAGFDIPDVPQMRGVVGAPGMSAETVAYYEDLFFKVSQTPAWKKFLAESQLDGEFVRAAAAQAVPDELRGHAARYSEDRRRSRWCGKEAPCPGRGAARSDAPLIGTPVLKEAGSGSARITVARRRRA